jgi:hypothetical protein
MTLDGNTDTTNGYNSVITNTTPTSSTSIKSVVPPLGSVLAWLKSLAHTPALPDGWVECNGQTLSDASSPYNGDTIPNLNGEVAGGLKGQFLRGHSSSGVTETPANVSHRHTIRASANIGDSVEPVNRYFSETSASNTYESTDGSVGGTMAANVVDLDGGTESRPYNYSVVWIMRVK